MINNKKIKSILEIQDKYDFNDDIDCIIDWDNVKDSSSLRDELERINQDYDFTKAEVIYCGNAIEYLRERDPSLIESLEIANDLGYKPSQLSSEILASLLKSNDRLDDWAEFIEEACYLLDSNCD